MVLVIRPAKAAAAANGETLGQGHGHPCLQPLALVAVLPSLGPGAPVTGGGVEPYGGREDPAGAGERAPLGSVQIRSTEVPALVPRAPGVEREPPAEAVSRRKPRALVHIVGLVRAPGVPDAAQHAELRVPGGEHPRTRVPRHLHPVEPPSGILPPRPVHAQAEPDPLPQRILVLAAAPDPQPQSRLGQLRRVPPERQPGPADVDVDGPLVGGAADVGVRRQRKAQVHSPAPPRTDLVEERLDVGHHRLRGLARQHTLEVLLRQGVLSLVEEGPRQLQAHARQAGLIDEHGAEQTRCSRPGAPRGRPAPTPRTLDAFQRREAEKKADVVAVGVRLCQRPQDRQRLLKLQCAGNRVRASARPGTPPRRAAAGRGAAREKAAGRPPAPGKKSSPRQARPATRCMALMGHTAPLSQRRERHAMKEGGRNDRPPGEIKRVVDSVRMI